VKIDGRPYRTIWLAADGHTVEVIDQTRLPHAFEIRTLRTLDDTVAAIRDMIVRGAPLIGATAGYGMALAMAADPSDTMLARAYERLMATRPTAVNLRWALDDLRRLLMPLPVDQRANAAYARADEICAADVAICASIGRHGLPLIEAAARRKKAGGRINVLTHCNAGWLATVDWGTALAPVYMAHDHGLDLHVWVDETRPRNQGASLTAFELGKHGVPHTVIADNTGGHLMQHGMVDLCIVGTDRTSRRGDVGNKIGTYLKALAARDNGVPFYAAVPSPSIDWTLDDGMRDIPIEERDGAEVSRITGRLPNGEIASVELVPKGTPVANYGFDVTPARLMSGLITERGVCEASAAGLLSLFPEHAWAA